MFWELHLVPFLATLNGREEVDVANLKKALFTTLVPLATKNDLNIIFETAVDCSPSSFDNFLQDYK